MDGIVPGRLRGVLSLRYRFISLCFSGAAVTKRLGAGLASKRSREAITLRWMNC